ncbi:hypothetical protein CRP_054 [Candidatus Carsonella ruddii PV]|uniref:Uncharacterized protein n=1 Tax=Carsonella ruddii (strain PV) TaxID=387662 RepID=Q05FT6_CARRP|nr:hypothetical protein [Candidatus Carsonella ruddii]BAF35085.1 hypothetical protein CRP_054 [Candidatus Carsonella ruddii PV]
MKYNIFIFFKKYKNKFFSIFFKNLVFFFYKFNIKILKIIDFGNIISFKKKNKRLFLIEIECIKNKVITIFKLFKSKNDVLSFFIILKLSIIKLITNNNYKKYLSKNFLIIPSLLFKIKFIKYKKIVKLIKILRILGILPYSIRNYISKINILC